MAAGGVDEKNGMVCVVATELVQSAYKSGDESGFELAWAEEQALRVLDILNAKGMTVTKVEPWLPTKRVWACCCVA